MSGRRSRSPVAAGPRWWCPSARPWSVTWCRSTSAAQPLASWNPCVACCALENPWGKRESPMAWPSHGHGASHGTVMEHGWWMMGTGSLGGIEWTEFNWFMWDMWDEHGTYIILRNRWGTLDQDRVNGSLGGPVYAKIWTKWMNFLFDANLSSFLGWVSVVLAEIAWIPWGT